MCYITNNKSTKKGRCVTMFDWLNDVTKGEDSLRPRLTKIGIAILIIWVLLSIWSYLN
jgi:hypothetical protein